MKVVLKAVMLDDLRVDRTVVWKELLKVGSLEMIRAVEKAVMSGDQKAGGKVAQKAISKAGSKD